MPIEAVDVSQLAHSIHRRGSRMASELKFVLISTCQLNVIPNHIVVTFRAQTDLKFFHFMSSYPMLYVLGSIVR